MKINRIINQHRRDFRADFECEHCGYVDSNKKGYDDAHFHNDVIPTMECPKCGKVADQDYRPLQTKYPEGFQV